jgi:hypothetical protein
MELTLNTHAVAKRKKKKEGSERGGAEEEVSLQWY